MDSEELVHGQSKAHFICGVEACEHCMCGFLIAAYTGRINCLSGYAHHMAHSTADRAVYRFIRLGLDGYPYFAVIAEHFIDGIYELPGGCNGALCLRAD